MADPLELLLSRLDKVQGRGSRFKARCPAHNDRGPSLSVTEADDGRILVHCFAGCDVHQVVSAVGLSVSDLFPPEPVRERMRYDRKPRKNYRAIVENARFAATIVAVYAAEVRKRWPDMAETLDLDERDLLIFVNSCADLRELLDG